MERHFTHKVEYLTDEPVSVEDVAHSLLANAALIRSTPGIIEAILPGVEAKIIEVRVQQIEIGSLREIVWGVVYLGIKDDLEALVPGFWEKATGLNIPAEADAIVTGATVILAYYVAEFVSRKYFNPETSKIRAQMNLLIQELSEKYRVPEAQIRKALNDRYNVSWLRSLTPSIIPFYWPSKGRKAHPIKVGQYKIEADTVAEIPRRANKRDLPPPKPLPYYHVDVEVVAEDLHSPDNWAAVVKTILPERKRLRLNFPIKPEEVYTHRYLKGDILAIMELEADGQLTPREYHLTRID